MRLVIHSPPTSDDLARVPGAREAAPGGDGAGRYRPDCLERCAGTPRAPMTNMGPADRGPAGPDWLSTDLPNPLGEVGTRWHTGHGTPFVLVGRDMHWPAAGVQVFDRGMWQRHGMVRSAGVRSQRGADRRRLPAVPGRSHVGERGLARVLRRARTRGARRGIA